MKSGYKNITILFLSLVVVMLGFGMVIPIVPFYIEKLGAGGTYLGILIASYSVMQFIFAPIWGSISDNIGRKPVLLIGMLGNAITILLFAISKSLWMLIVARALSECYLQLQFQLQWHILLIAQVKMKEEGVWVCLEVPQA